MTSRWQSLELCTEVGSERKLESGQHAFHRVQIQIPAGAGRLRTVLTWSWLRYLDTVAPLQLHPVARWRCWPGFVWYSNIYKKSQKSEF